MFICKSRITSCMHGIWFFQAAETLHRVGFHWAMRVTVCLLAVRRSVFELPETCTHKTLWTASKWTHPEQGFFVTKGVWLRLCVIIEQANRAEFPVRHSNVGSPVDLVLLPAFRGGNACWIQGRLNKRGTSPWSFLWSRYVQGMERKKGSPLSC